MTVTKYAQINIAGMSLSTHPVHYVCSTTAELPVSGLKRGDTALALDTNTQYKADTSTSWVVAGGTGGGSGTTVPSAFIVKTADQSVTSSTALQNDTHLFFPMASGEVWLVTATLIANSASATPGIKLGLSLPSGATARWSFAGQWEGNLPTAASPTAASTVATPLPATGVPASMDPFMFRYLVVNSSTAGNFQLTWAQATSSSTPTNLRKYSVLAALKVA